MLTDMLTFQLSPEEAKLAKRSEKKKLTKFQLLS